MLQKVAINAILGYHICSKFHKNRFRFSAVIEQQTYLNQTSKLSYFIIGQSERTAKKIIVSNFWHG